jgi:MFS family permease
MTRVAPERRGALGGLYNVTWATGFSLGPLLSGWIQVRSGFAPAFAMSAACFLAAAGCMYLFFRGSVPIEDSQG